MEETRVISKVYSAPIKKKGSKQLPSDPFGRLYSQYGLVKPIYPLEKLSEMKESNPIHSACIEQKAADVAGLGWQWVQADTDTTPKTDTKAMQAFLENGCPDLTFREILQAMWEDYETLGWGMIEVVTDATGAPAELYYVPAHTVRAHSDGIRFAQIRNGVMRWFKRFGVDGEFNLLNGEPGTYDEENQAGQLLVIKKPGGRSSYYGVPGYVAALGSIVGSQSVRDFNINFFDERTIPDTLLVVKGADVTPEVESDLKSFFAGNRNNHNKLVILPVPFTDVEVTVERLTPDMKDASFRLYRQDNALEICIAHRVPPYRIGWPITGSLGGSTAKEMTEIYKRSVVEPGQEILEHRINNQLLSHFKNNEWKWKLNDIDVSDEMADLDYAVKGMTNSLLSVNEGRQIIGQKPLDGKLKEEGEKFYRPSSWAEVGAEPPEENGPQNAQGQARTPGDEQNITGNQQNATAGKLEPNPGKSSADGLEKGENHEVDIPFYKDWVGLHAKQEKQLQKVVDDFFVGRPAE